MATRKSNSKNTNSKAVLAFFSENAVARTRTSKSGDGGRYNAKTRRLVVPTKFSGRAVAVAVADGIVVVGGEGSYKCHPTQHFVTLPAGTVDSAESVTLEKVDLPTAVASLGDDAVAYKLPTADAKPATKKSSKKSTKPATKKSTKKSTKPATKSAEPESK